VLTQTAVIDAALANKLGFAQVRTRGKLSAGARRGLALTEGSTMSEAEQPWSAISDQN
jgi:hypothetical protein